MYNYSYSHFTKKCTRTLKCWEMWSMATKNIFVPTDLIFYYAKLYTVNIMIDISKIMVTSTEKFYLVFSYLVQNCYPSNKDIIILKPKLFSIFISDQRLLLGTSKIQNNKKSWNWFLFSNIWEGFYRKALTYFVLKRNYKMTKQFLALRNRKGDERRLLCVQNIFAPPQLQRRIKISPVHKLHALYLYKIN